MLCMGTSGRGCYRVFEPHRDHAIIGVVRRFTKYSKTCLKRTLKGPENFSAKGNFRLIKVHYIQYKKLNQDMHVLN